MEELRPVRRGQCLPFLHVPRADIRRSRCCLWESVAMCTAVGSCHTEVEGGARTGCSPPGDGEMKDVVINTFTETALQMLLFSFHPTQW